MPIILEHLGDHWLACALLVLGLAWWFAPVVLARGSSIWWFPGVLSPAALILFSMGGLIDLGIQGFDWYQLAGILLGIQGFDWHQLAGILSLSVVLILFLLFILVVVSGQWWAPGGYALGALLLVCLGGIGCALLQPALTAAGQLVVSLRPAAPWWLVLLLGLPVIVALSFRSLAGLGPRRRALAIGLRCVVVSLLVLALAEMHAQRPNDNLTVLFLWDRSLSIPQEFDAKRPDRDLREERLLGFINDTVRLRGKRKQGDIAGVIVFGRSPRVELPPPEKGVADFKLRKIVSKVDDTYTDIGAAIKLALASFPGGTGKRIVLISDGNENLGQAEEQARIAKQNGVEIDIVPVAAGRKNINEVLVERVEAPPAAEKDARLPIRIVLRSHHPEVVVGKLLLTKISLDLKKSDKDGQERPTFEAVPILETRIKLTQGLNVFFFQQPGSKKDEAYTYEAKFVPSHVEDGRGNLVQDKLLGDRIENNRASATVMARGQQSILLLEPTPGDHTLLVNRLLKARPSLKIVATDPTRLRQDPAELAVILSKFDCVILANLPADSLTEEQQKVIRSNTHDQGCGLIMIGGNQSFGAGGWQGTEVEKALPVLCDLKTAKVEGKSGLVLMMHASEMAEGNAWQRKIAALAIQKLSPMDMVGMLYYDHGQRGGGHQWHIPFQDIGNRRGAILKLLDSLNPGDMPDVDPAFEKAYKELNNPAYNLGTKHIIFISDGDHWDASKFVLDKLKSAKITCTTVCITTHGQAEIVKMGFVAKYTGGRGYHIKDPSELPAIYIKESRLVSQSFVHELKDGFKPNLLIKGGPTEGFNELEPLYGYVRTTTRPSALVEVPIETPVFKDKNKFPLLATWQYGLGKSVAFTSDARTIPGGPTFWDRDWANSQTHGKFWEQTVDWSMRPGESGKFLHLTTEHRDGKVHIVVESRDGDKKPLTEVEFKAGISSPSFKEADASKEIRFEQKNAGVYEAIVSAEEVGAYFIHLQAKWKDPKTGQLMTDGVRSGVTIPYSPEFAEMESNPALLDRLRDLTGGQEYVDDATTLAHVARTGDVFRPAAGQFSLQPLWYWLVLLAGVGLFFDVAVRRISVDPMAAWHLAEDGWRHMRGQARIDKPQEFIERLRSRKAQVGESLATRRFEGSDDAGSPVPAASGPTSPSTPAKPRPTPKLAPQTEAEAQDFASRLLRAKRKAMDERDKK